MTTTDHRSVPSPASARSSRSSSARPSASRAPASRGPVPRTATAPPRARVRARARLTEDTLLRRGGVEPGADARTIARLLEEEREDSRRHARRLADLAPFWIDHEDPDLDDDREERSLAVAIATRTTTAIASYRIADAHTAVTEMPATFERLTAGDMPVEWHTRMLKAVRDLTAVQRAQVDEIVASWDLASVPADRFRDELRQLRSWFDREMSAPRPESLRDVSLENSLHDDGTACLRITGPIPEILDLARRLDRSATTVQARQRRALEQGEPIPFDLDGDVARDGKAMSQAALRYAILLRTQLDTGGVEIPAPRHRVNVVVPVLTLMGLSDTPALYDGIHPLPAQMARDLAAAEPVWHRVFADAADGGFLPLPAERYRPSAEQVEHLRLLHPRCAAPCCTHTTTDDAENDHIEEFDHADPARGGPTSLHNLHRLDWRHHDLKTAGRIDPVREPDGATTWTVGSPALITTRVAPRGDLAAPHHAKALMESWEEFCWRRDLDQMQANGEIDRIMQEWGPADPLHDPPLDPDEENREYWEQGPPF